MIKKVAPRKYQTDSHWIMLLGLFGAGLDWFFTLGYEPLYINGKKYGGWKEKLECLKKHQK